MGLRKGTGSVSISASGTLRQPDVLGRIEARADSIDLAGSDAPSIRDGRLVIRFDGNHADVDEMSAILAGGNRVLSGDFSDGAFDAAFAE